MGLAIAKSVVELHQGTISARSRGTGLGSSFLVELPTTKVGDGVVKAGNQPPTPQGAPEEAARALTILLVDDHVDTSNLLSRVLGSEGHLVKVAYDISSAKRRCEEHHFDLVISDLGLPDGNGLDLMRYLKERNGLPGIAVSGYGMEEDLRKSQEAGFLEHITKPVDVERLLAVIARVSAAVGTPATLPGEGESGG